MNDMTSDVSPVTRWSWVVALLGSVAAISAWLVHALGQGLFALDFSVFHLGGSMIRTSGYGAAYDHAGFETAMVGYHPSLADDPSIAHFISSPNFGWVVQALALVDRGPALVAWTVAGLVAAAVSARMLGLDRRWLPVIVLSPWFVLNVTLGQTGAFALLAFAAAVRCAAADRRWALGAIVGLLALKPTLLVGFAALWILRPREHRREITAAAAAAALFVLPTVVDGLAPWRAFLDSTANRVELESDWAQLSLGFYEFGKALTPGSGSTSSLLWAGLALASTFGLAELTHRRWAGDVAAQTAAAAVLTVWGSPHLLAYDALILVAPVAVLAARGQLDARRAGILAALFSMPLAIGPALTAVQHDLLGRAIAVETVAFVVAVVLMVRWASAPKAGREADQSRYVRMREPSTVSATT